MSFKCHTTDDKKIVEAANRIFRDTIKESPDLPDLEPFKLTIGTIGVVYIKFLKPKYTGIEETIIKSITGFKRDPDNNTLKVRIKISKAAIEGPYELYGKIAISSINITGHGAILLDDVDISLIMKTTKVLDDDDIYMNVTETDFSYTVKKAKLNFDNDRLGPMINKIIKKVLNKNWKTILKQQETPINASLGKFYQNIANTLLQDTTYDEFFGL